jgi:hypothetical protein
VSRSRRRWPPAGGSPGDEQLERHEAADRVARQAEEDAAVVDRPKADAAELDRDPPEGDTAERLEGTLTTSYGPTDTPLTMTASASASPASQPGQTSSGRRPGSMATAPAASTIARRPARSHRMPAS